MIYVARRSRPILRRPKQSVTDSWRVHIGHVGHWHANLVNDQMKIMILSVEPNRTEYPLDSKTRVTYLTGDGEVFQLVFERDSEDYRCETMFVPLNV